MRELKFRAWRNIDGKLRRYVFSPFAYEYPDADEPVFHAESDVNDIRDFMPLADVIEQYTGLKDKNGKEIYEGDIVILTGRVAKNKCSVYKVGWDGFLVAFDLFPVERNKSDIGYLNEAEAHRYEIIGNIHKNPELLEDKK